MIRRIWDWLTRPRPAVPPEQTYPDRRRPKTALKTLTGYQGMTVAVTYQTTNGPTVVKGTVTGIRQRPYRSLIVDMYGFPIMLGLDRISSITAIHGLDDVDLPEDPEPSSQRDRGNMSSMLPQEFPRGVRPETLGQLIQEERFMDRALKRMYDREHGRG